MRRTASEVLRSLEMRVARLENQSPSVKKATNKEVVSTIRGILKTGSLTGSSVVLGSSLALCERLYKNTAVSEKTKKALAGVLKVMTDKERHSAYGIKFKVRTRATEEMSDVLNRAIESGDHATLLKTIKRPDYASALGEIAIGLYTDVAKKLKKLKSMDRKVFEILREELQLHQGNVDYRGKIEIINSEILWKVKYIISNFNKIDYLGAQIFPNAYMRANITENGFVVTFKVSDFIEGLLRRERSHLQSGGDPRPILENERKIPVVLSLLAKRIEKRTPGFLKLVGDLGYKMEENLSVERREIIQTYREDPSWGENEYDREFEEGDLEAKWEVPFTFPVVDALYELALKG